ncbi:MAG: sugar transferase [Butyrivibrio sp.]|nr:sugar transferase [Butyrivibrio sp.]
MERTCNSNVALDTSLPELGLKAFEVVAPIRVNKSISYRFTKRAFDMIASILALAILMPVLLLTALFIVLEDHGPVLFIQKRVGKNGKIFSMYKFRSMKVGADKLHEKMKAQYGCSEVSFKLKEDPRNTKVGKIIRATNIDELPQLINILKGDMSFVGPRPLPVYEYEEEQQTYNGKYNARYGVPQGLTCIWQISNRSMHEFEDRMQMDVDYAEKCSISMDLKLLVQTFIYCLLGKASY